MRFALLALCLLPALAHAQKPVHVDGYYRKDGTYVRPHDRSLPHHKTGSGSPAEVPAETPRATATEAPKPVPVAEQTPPEKVSSSSSFEGWPFYVCGVLFWVGWVAFKLWSKSAPRRAVVRRKSGGYNPFA